MKTPSFLCWRRPIVAWLALPVLAFAVNDLTVSNTTYTTTQTISADNSITATPAVVVANGANITFQAAGHITLGSGFSVATGGLFRTSVGQLQVFVTGFESTDGLSLGSVHNQRGWTVTQGAAEVVTADFIEGARSLALQAGGTAAVASTGFVVSSAPAITFLDLYIKPVAASTAAASSVVQTEAAKVGFQIASGLGEIYSFDGVGTNQWVASGWRFSLNGSNQATGWLRLTLRLDYTNKKWDLYAGGVMIDYDAAFASTSETFFRQLSLSGVTSAAAYADAITASDTNPLFTDADKDGMDDAWESAHGLNPAVNDRNSNLDGDSFTNIQEYLLGTKPNNADVTKPSTPTGLSTTSVTATTLGLSWTASTDPAGAGTPGVAGYHVYRGTTKLNTSLVIATSFTDTGYNPAFVYSYTVRAVDLAGNLSDASTPLVVTAAGSFEVFTPLP